MLINLCLLIPLLLVAEATFSNWPSPAIAWWYDSDENWPLLIEEIAPHKNVVTSVIVSCGSEVTDSGNITTTIYDTCLDSNGNGTLPAIRNLGILTELVLFSGNCSIDAYRLLWADKIYSIQTLVDIAIATNISGWNIDLEPVSDNCAGQATGTAADAVAYAEWLAVLQVALHAINVRLTVDVADWSPVISEFTTLMPSVDRLMDMETYNAASWNLWMYYYGRIVNATIPRHLAGVGLGCWVDSTVNGTWSVTAASATERVKQVITDGVPELAMWRLLPISGVNPPSFPEQFWWSALSLFTANSSQQS